MKDILSMTAAQFKRQVMNKAAHQRASQAVQLRTTIGASKAVSMQDKHRVRDSWTKRDMDPMGFHKPNGEFRPLRKDANAAHLRSGY